MDSSVIIDLLQAQDLLQVVTLINTLVPWEVSAEEARAAFEVMRAQPDVAVLVAKEGDTVLGTVTVACSQTLAAKFASIEDVVVSEQCRGRGVGTRLMAAANDFARGRGCGYMIIVSSGHRVKAHRFYEKCGFTEDVRGFRKDCQKDT